MMVYRLLKSAPDGKLTVFKSGLFGGQNVWLSELEFTSWKFLCFWQCEREHRPAAVTIKLTATSHLDVG